MKATAAGETAQAKKDMARLAEMKRREAKRQSAGQGKGGQGGSKGAGAIGSRGAQGRDDSDDEDDIPTKIEIKKMKPSAVRNA